MRAVRVSGIRRLRGLKNISWLTSRQLNRLAVVLTTSRVEKHSIIFDGKHSPESVYVLLSGVARITCRNRKGDRTLVIMVAPGMIPGFPPPVVGIRYNFRCEAVTECQIGAVELETFIEIALENRLGRLQARSRQLFWTMGLGTIALREFHELHA
jgi:CRP-like cAMP-binding protein